MRRLRRAGSGTVDVTPTDDGARVEGDGARVEGDARAGTLRRGRWWRGPFGLLCAAAILHLALALLLYELGRREVVPGAVDASGVVVAVAPDAVVFREDAAALSGLLRAGEFRYWFGSDYPFHVKLYSIPFAFLGPWLGYNVLSAEPLNAFLYLAALASVFRVGREVFGRRAGLLAACAAALWPSSLLHSTQFLKDPVYVACFLAIVVILVRLLTRDYSWPRAWLTCAASVPVLIALWLARGDMGGLLVVTVLVTLLMLAARQFRERRLRAANLAGAALLLVATAGVPLVMRDAIELGRWHGPAGVKGGGLSGIGRPTESEDREELREGAVWTRGAAKVGAVRRRFAQMYPDSGSNIDADVEIRGAADVLSYLPRAAVVGFFAPFPNMWLASGKRVGSTGRRLAGLESLAMYAVEALAIFGLWRGRREPAAWLLAAAAAAGMTALGLVVVNVGALYRLRYVFVVLLIVLAAGAAADLFGRLWESARGRGERGVAG